MVERYLRTFTTVNERHLDRILALAEFSYNSHAHKATGMSLFEADTTENQRMPLDVMAVAVSFSTKMNDILHHLTDALKITQAANAETANRTRQLRDFQVGNSVFLNTRHPPPGTAPAKPYRAISLLNCLGKMVGKVAAMLVSAHCESMGWFHPGQYGCRIRLSAVDAVGVVIAQTHEAWKRGRITGALLMDVAAAFPSVARGSHLRKMRAMGIDENLVSWTDSFMRDRRVIMSVDGQDDNPREVTTGLPQGSPISPVLFAIYIADIHVAVEGQVQDSRGISFVNDVTWLVEGRDVGEVVQKLEGRAAASLEWARGNAVCFETSKTEAILFSRRRAHK